MATVVENIIGLDVNSDPAAGAINISDDNAQFEVNLTVPIKIPNTAFHCTVKVDEATVSNTVYNISEELKNNEFSFLWRPSSEVAPPPIQGFVVEFPDGSYDVDTLNETLQDLIAATIGDEHRNKIRLTGDEPTQKVRLEIAPAGTGLFPEEFQVDLNTPETVAPVIGFTPAVYPGAPTTTFFQVLGDFIAKFNNLEYFLLHADIGEGLRTNDRFDQTIAKILITARPGSQIVYQPLLPAITEANSMLGQERKHFVFWLTDHRGIRVNTHEPWSARLTFTYQQFIFAPDPNVSHVTGGEYASAMDENLNLTNEKIRLSGRKRKEQRTGFF